MSSDTESRYLQSRKVSLISFTTNIVLGVAKLIIGITAGSKALIADGVHSFSDMASTAVILVSLRLSKQAPDSTHPYGHGKAEPIGTAILGSLLLITGGLLARDALFNMLTGDMSVPGGLAVWGAVISIMTKELLY
ncbi:MAG: cation diffusion facilitator family transporter, partial [Bacillota bacterium]